MQPNQTPPVAPQPAATPPATPVATAPAAPVAATTAYAGFWRRFAAIFIDGIIIGIVVGGILSVLGYNNQGSSYINSVVVLVYSVLLINSAWQATVGKKAMGVKVTMVDGSKPPLQNIIIRELMKFVSAIILGIGYLMMLWSDKKQTLHDKVAGTVVVKD